MKLSCEFTRSAVFWKANRQLAEEQDSGISINPCVTFYEIELSGNANTFRVVSWVEPEFANLPLDVSFSGITHEHGYRVGHSVLLSDDSSREPSYCYVGKLKSSVISDAVPSEMSLLGGVIEHEGSKLNLNSKEFWKSATVTEESNKVVAEVYCADSMNARIRCRLSLRAIKKGWMPTELEIQTENADGTLQNCLRYSLNLNETSNRVTSYRREISSGGKYVPDANISIRFDFFNPPEFWPLVFEKCRPPLSKQVLVEDREVESFFLSDGKLTKAIDSSVLKYANLGAENGDLDVGATSYLRENSQKHCGVYAAAVVANAKGLRIDVGSAIESQFIDRTSGSSSEQLCELLSDCGLSPVVLRGCDMSFLDASGNEPALLHIRVPNREVGHWVAYLGKTSEGALRIVDLPRDEDLYARAELLTQWDGVAIFPARESIPVLWCRVKSASNKLFWMTPALGLLLLFSRFRTRLKGWVGILSIVLASLVSSAIFQLFCGDSPLNNPLATRHVESSSVNVVEELSQLNVSDEWGNCHEDGCLVIDARTPKSFALGSYPNALNLPIDATLPEIRDCIERIGDKKVVVYCQSEKCMWANVIGCRLSRLADIDASVFEPGWVELKKIVVAEREN